MRIANFWAACVLFTGAAFTDQWIPVIVTMIAVILTFFHMVGDHEDEVHIRSKSN